jgi:hypothetical protein
MERGKETRGKVAAMVAGAQAVEFKATIPEKQIKAAIQLLRLRNKDAEERFIYFYDKPNLSLFAAGVIMRARRIPGGQHDSTVKFRPVKEADISAKWRKCLGFKLETDLSEKGAVQSASMTIKVKKGLIKSVDTGETAVGKLFTDTQEKFLGAVGGKKMEFSGIAVLGPIRAQRWVLDVPALPWKLTVELWSRDDGERVLEGSIKVPPVQAAVASAGFLGYLAELGAERDKAQEAKTRWALGYYSAKLHGKKAARNA